MGFIEDASASRLKEAVLNGTPFTEAELKEIVIRLVKELEGEREITNFWKKDAEINSMFVETLEKRIKLMEARYGTRQNTSSGQ